MNTRYYSDADLRLLPEAERQPRQDPILLIFHSIVGSAAAAYGFFRDKSNLESHMIFPKRGGSWQLVPFDRTADANRLANPMSISCETEDNGNPNVDPWTDNQLEEMADFGIWVCHHSLVLPRRAPSWNQSGIGFHTMWGSPSPWTPVAKSCPGTVRIKQFERELLPAIVNGYRANVMGQALMPELFRVALQSIVISEDEVEKPTDRVSRYRYPTGSEIIVQRDGSVLCPGGPYFGGVPSLRPKWRMAWNEALSIAPIDPLDPEAGYKVYNINGDEYAFHSKMEEMLGEAND